MKMTNAEKDAIQEKELREIMNDAVLTRKTYKELRDVRFSTGTKFRSYLERKYGGVLNYGDAHEIDTRYMVSNHILTSYRLSKITKEEVTARFLELAETSIGLLESKTIISSPDGEFLLSAINHYYGGLNNISNDTQTHIKTMSSIKRSGLEISVISDFKNGESITSIKQNYGLGHRTIVKWLQESGEYEERMVVDYLTKEETDKFLDITIERSYSEKFTSAQIRKNHRIEFLSAKHYYKSFTKAIMSRGKYLLESNIRITWNESFLAQQIKLGHELKRPMNSNYMLQGKGKGAEYYARLKYGSWKNAVELAGVPYNYTSSVEFAELGHEFEALVGNLFDELGYKYEKYSRGTLQPDFVLQDKWIDAKLSEYTYQGKDRNGVTCVDKYEPHCEYLELVYLRGSGRTRKITDKTTLVYVGDYVEQLPKERRQHYYGLLSEIEGKANGIEYVKGA